MELGGALSCPEGNPERSGSPESRRLSFHCDRSDGSQAVGAAIDTRGVGAVPMERVLHFVFHTLQVPWDAVRPRSLASALRLRRGVSSQTA